VKGGLLALKTSILKIPRRTIWRSRVAGVVLRIDLLDLMGSCLIFFFYIPVHPTGINAVETSRTPRSAVSRLNCAAAFLVSCTSILIPSRFICLLVSGESGYTEAPRPRIKRSICYVSMSVR